MEIKIITTNDIHGRFFQENNTIDFAKLSEYRKTLNNPSQAKYCLLIDAGDATQGTPLAIIDRGASVIDIMNTMGYDGMTIGNHELDNVSASDKEALEENISNCSFPVISMNLRIKDAGSSEMNYISWIKKKKGIDVNGEYFIKKCGDIKLGFIGVSTPETPAKFGLIVENTQDEINARMKKITDHLKNVEEVNLIIIVAHMGSMSSTMTSTQLAKSNPDIDLIIDGHSHEKYTRIENGVRIIQADCNANYFGLITLNFENGKLNKDKIDLLTKTNKELPTLYDEAVRKKLDELKTETNDKYGFGTVYVNSSHTSLWGGSIDIIKRPVRKGINIARCVQTNFGSLATEALIAAYRNGYEFIKDEYKDFHIIGGINGGSLRDTIGFGKPITKSDLFYASPSHMESETETETGFKVVKITVATLAGILKNSIKELKFYNRIIIGSAGLFLNLSRIQITLKNEQNVISIDDKIILIGTVSNPDVKAVLSLTNDASKELLICANTYIADGGDGYKIYGLTISHIKTPLYEIFGNYISSISNKSLNRLEYRPKYEPILYDGFDFLPPEPLKIVIKDINGSPLTGKKLIYSYNFDTKEYVTYTDNDGYLIINSELPEGEAVIKLTLIEAYGKNISGELYTNSYIGIGNWDSVEWKISLNTNPE